MNRRGPAALAVALTLASCQEPLAPRPPVEVFAYDRGHPLAAETTLVRDSAGVRIWAVSFVSPGGGRATGYLAVPTGIGRRPAVLLQHGLPGSAERVLALSGGDLTARGAVVLALDAPWQRRGGDLTLTPWDSVEQVQLIHDLQRGVDLLLARQDVDPSRLAFVGGGYGGAMGALLAGVERRIAAYALHGADGGLVAHLTDAAGAPRAALALLDTAARDRWLAAMGTIEPLRFLPLAPPAAVLLQHATSDDPDTRRDAELLRSAARPPRTLQWFTPGALAADGRAARMAWLREQIGLGAAP